MLFFYSYFGLLVASVYEVLIVITLSGGLATACRGIS